MKGYVYLVLAGICTLCICTLFCTVCSCSTGETVARIFGSRSEMPVFLSVKAVSEAEIDFEFSIPVRVMSLRFSPVLEIESIEDGSTVRVIYADGPGPGQRLTADLLVEDEAGNTLNVLVSLRARNSRIPAMRINELRTEYSKPRAEFIEFKTLEAGNLGALRVFIAGNYRNPLVYEFPPVEVATGEYILLHLRTLEETSRDELGGNLDESGGFDAVAGVRDLWIPGSAKLLHKTDAVYVLDQDDRVIDAVMLCDSAGSVWSKDYLAEAAEFLFSHGAWQSVNGTVPGPEDAVYTGKTTATRTICRDETATDTNTAADWYVTVTSGATAGKPNNPKRFQD